MNILISFCMILWLYMITVFDRAKNWFYKYIWGSVGLFIIMMITIEPYLTIPLAKSVAAVAGIIGNLTGLYTSYFQYSLLFINNSIASISLYIDYECSGVIEMMAFISLLWFFPAYQFLEKCIVSVAGIILIFAANVLRIISICLLIYFYGDSIYYFAHTIFGRMIFYAFSVFLYFYVFTRTQIVRQGVGSFSYVRSD